MVEELVNREVMANHPIVTEVLSMDEARKRGAMMIFEEKYGDTVRMLRMGPSTELCGGTHARNTGEIGLFKIVSEQGVAAGVRRLLATTGENSLAYVQQLESKWERAAEISKVNPDQLLDKMEKMGERQKALEKEIEALKRKLLTGGATGMDAYLAQARDVSGVKVLGVQVEVSDRAQLREFAEQLRDRLGERSVVLVGAQEADKVALVVVVAKALTDKLKAGELIKSCAALVGGSGGGRPDMAQAGGTQVAGLAAAVEQIYAAAAASL